MLSEGGLPFRPSAPGDDILILQGRAISRGRAEGRALVLRSAFSFLGGVSPQTGLLTVSSGREGETLEGRVFVFLRGKGSTVGSYTLLDLRKNGHLPSAIINESAETIVATGAVMASVPMVDGIDISLIMDDDQLVVDGAEGTVEIVDVILSEVVTCVLRHEGKVLALKRSEKVSTNKLKWAGVSGFVEKGEQPLETAYKEIAEETGIEDPHLIKMGRTVLVRSDGRIWKVHPFLFEVGSPLVTIDWEHTDHRWLFPSDLDNMDVVPGFRRLLNDLEL
jgi:predicted aconitase with swiveling domain/8-oxo-dGTP pyrophosphatase MutT (NUDIX family)